MAARVERIGQQIKHQIEWQSKSLFAKCAPGLRKVSPELLQGCCALVSEVVNNSSFEKITGERFEAVENLKFALRTILEARGIAISEKEIVRLARETTKSYLVSALETLGALPWPEFIEPAITDEVRKFFEQKGIIASFHSGNFVVAGPSLRKIYTRDVAVFMERQPDSLQERINSYVREFEMVPIFVDEMLKKPIETTKKLQDIPLLITLFDRPPKEKNSAVEVTFFGKSASFLREPAQLSLLLKRPILPVAVVRVGSSCYTAEIGRIIFPEQHYKPGDKKETVRAITQAVVANFEPMILKRLISFYTFFEPIFKN